MTTKKKTARKRTVKRKTAAKRKAAAKKTATRKTAAKRARAADGLKAGTTITRRFKGKDYRLRVTEDGFKLGKAAFRSLTAAAKHVTDYASVSGVRFWLGADKKAGS